ADPGAYPPADRHDRPAQRSRCGGRTEGDHQTTHAAGLQGAAASQRQVAPSARSARRGTGRAVQNFVQPCKVPVRPPNECLPRHAPNSAGASFFTGDGNQQLSPGTAQTLSIGELGGAFSGLGLELCGLATAALMPLINRLLWQALRGLHFAEKTRGTQDG